MHLAGAGISFGYTLNFKIVWSGGSPLLDAAFNLEIADWASIEIQFTKSTDSFNNMISDCSGLQAMRFAPRARARRAPSYLPTGEAPSRPMVYVQRWQLR